jgi:fatty-acyl-CoA synthase
MKQLQQDWAAKWAVYSPDREAFKEYETGRVWTYGQINRLANQLAHHFTNDRGLLPGDRIAVLAENCLEYILLFSVAQKTGITLVPLNYRLAPAEIDYLLRSAEPRLVIGEAKFMQMLEDAPQYALIEQRLPLEELAAWLQAPLAGAARDHFNAIPLEEDHPVFILFTSGTTGFPKGALYTHRMLFWNSINTAMSLILNTESRTVNVMPPFHTGGWNVFTTPFFHHGAYMVLMKKFDPEALLPLLQSERATIFMGVPTMLKMLADQPGFDSADFSSLYYIIVGGEAMPIPLIERWHEKGVPIRQGYGLTEVGPNLTSLHQRDAVRKKGSIGRPNFYVQIKVADPETGAELGPDQPGEFLLKGPMTTPGYWKNPEATAKAIKDGWFHTGDMVRQDAEGYIYVVDRIKNMFISGGENVYPAEVERVLLQCEGVAEACVVGVPHEKWGEVGRAFVVKKDPALDEAALLEFCQGKLARFKIPKSVIFLPALPKNDTGKINRMELKNFH